MTRAERDHVIDACIQRVLSLREDTRDPADQEAAVTITGAACFRLLQLKSEPLPAPDATGAP